MRIQTIVPRTFASNCYILSGSGQALVVDPSVSPETIYAALDGNTLVGILLTHGHFDHIASIDKLRDEKNIPVYIHKNDAEMLTDSKKNAFYTFFHRDTCYSPADVLLEDGDEIHLGNETVKAISTPGHSRGSVCYDCGSFLVTGDTLFADSIGRCDLYGGSDEDIRASLTKLEKSYPQDMRIYPGHGTTSRLGAALDNVFYYR